MHDKACHEQSDGTFHQALPSLRMNLISGRAVKARKEKRITPNGVKKFSGENVVRLEMFILKLQELQ